MADTIILLWWFMHILPRVAFIHSIDPRYLSRSLEDEQAKEWQKYKMAPRKGEIMER